MDLLYRDSELAVVRKESGETSESVLEELAAPRGTSVHPIHRLDQPVTGALVVAFGRRAAAALSRALAEGRLERTYLAVCQRNPEAVPGPWEDQVFFDKRGKRSRVADDSTRRDAQSARMHSERIGSTERYDVWRFRLETGRRHQIRVQCAYRGLPVVGDLKYGARRSRRGGGIYLHAVSVALPHPVTGQRLKLWAYPPREPLWDAAWQLLDAAPTD